MPKCSTIPDKFQSGFLDNLDSRTSIAREIRERYQNLTDDLGSVDNLSYQQRSLCERAIWLEYFLASQERELAEGKAFDSGKWTQAVNALQGLYSKLGLSRQVREVSLSDLIKKSHS